MTEQIDYAIRMNILSLHNLLIPLAFQGLLWTLVLLVFCFGGVIVANLARLGWEYKSERAKAPDSFEKSQDAPKNGKKAPAEKPQEPIYYIVEKKRRRPTPGCEKPKPFQFKER